MDPITVIAPGSGVTVRIPGDATSRRGHVSGVSIGRKADVRYLVNWWSKDEFQEKWLDADLVDATPNVEKLTVNFRQEP